MSGRAPLPSGEGGPKGRVRGYRVRHIRREDTHAEKIAGSGCGIAEHSDSSFAGKYRLIATSSTSIVTSFASSWNWMEWFMTDRNRQRKIGSETHVYSNWDRGYSV